MTKYGTSETHKLTMTGDTKPSRDALKARGWKWNPEKGHWWMSLVDAHAERILAGDDEFLRGLNGTRKGCQVRLDGVVVWTSKTYAQPVATQPRSQYADQDGYGWNCDQFGNAVAAKRIPGSAADDMI